MQTRSPSAPQTPPKRYETLALWLVSAHALSAVLAKFPARDGTRTPPAKAVTTGSRAIHYFLVLAIICCVCFVVAIWPWFRAVGINGNVVARSITLNLAKGLDIEPDVDLDQPRATIEGADEVSGEAARPTDGPLHLSAETVRLTGIRAQPNGTLALSRTADTLEIRIDNQGGAFDLELVTGTRARVVSARRMTEGGSLILRVGARSKLELDEFAVSDIRFGQSRGVTTSGPAFSSTVMSGALTLPDTGRTEPLPPATSVRLTKFDGSVVRTTISDEGIHIWFNGKVRDVAVGSLDDPVSIWPTSIEILEHSPGYKLAGGIVATILTVFAALGQWHLARKLS